VGAIVELLILNLLSAIWKCLYFAGDRGQLLGNALQERLLASSRFSLGTASKVRQGQHSCGARDMPAREQDSVQSPSSGRIWEVLGRKRVIFG